MGTRSGALLALRLESPCIGSKEAVYSSEDVYRIGLSVRGIRNHASIPCRK